MTLQRQLSGRVPAYEKARDTFGVAAGRLVMCGLGPRKKTFTRSATSFLLNLMRSGRSH